MNSSYQKSRIFVTLVVFIAGILIGTDLFSGVMCDCVYMGDGFDYSIFSPVAWFDLTDCRCGHTTFSQLLIDYLYLLPALVVYVAWGFLIKQTEK